MNGVGKHSGPPEHDIPDAKASNDALQALLRNRQHWMQEAAEEAKRNVKIREPQLVVELDLAFRQLEKVSRDANPSILISAENPVASRIQSVLAEQSQAGESSSSTSGPLKFGIFDISWSKVLLESLTTRGRHPLLRPHSVEPTLLPNEGRIAVLGGWATGLYGAPIVAKTIKADPKPFSLLLYLGNVYYSGTKREVAQRFLPFWPKRSDAISRQPRHVLWRVGILRKHSSSIRARKQLFRIAE